MLKLTSYQQCWSVNTFARTHCSMKVGALNVGPSLVDVIYKGVHEKHDVLLDVFNTISDLTNGPVVTVNDLGTTLGFGDLGTDFNGTLDFIDLGSDIFVGFDGDGFLLSFGQDVTQNLENVLGLSLGDQELIILLCPNLNGFLVVLIKTSAEEFENFVLNVVLCAFLIIFGLASQGDTGFLALLAVGGVSQEQDTDIVLWLDWEDNLRVETSILLLVEVFHGNLELNSFIELVFLCCSGTSGLVNNFTAGVAFEFLLILLRSDKESWGVVTLGILLEIRNCLTYSFGL